MRPVNDESAPAFKAVRTGSPYPYRQKKELVARANELLAEPKITGHDAHGVREALRCRRRYQLRTSSTSRSSHPHNTVRPSQSGWQKAWSQTWNSFNKARARHPKSMSPSRSLS